MDSRQTQLSAWVAEQLNIPQCELEIVSGDASFRRYFRVFDGARNWVLMDAPPEKEDSDSFVAIARSWFRDGIQVPEIKAVDLELGFMILGDMGNDLLLTQLDPESPNQAMGDKYYSQAMTTLLAIQSSAPIPEYTLPPYDRALLDREMALFKDWLVEKKLGLSLSQEEQQLIASTFDLLAEAALAQPKVPVHRDYHSRNLMILDDDSLGVLDFQDAVQGPITYDLVSLLRDCYIVWPVNLVDKWLAEFYDLLLAHSGVNVDFQTFKQWFDWMGLQRHLKASGIFARLSLRDGKHGYLDDIPRTVDYLVTVTSLYPELSDFQTWLKDRVIPELTKLEAA